MAGVEVAAAVSAVVSAFHGGAELVKQMKKRRRRNRNDQASEKQLQMSLEAGEFQVQQRDTAYRNELGIHFQVGDVIARDRLLHIAVVLQAEVIRSLQIAAKNDDSIIDFSVLYDTSVVKRTETIIALDELRMRVIHGLPMQGYEQYISDGYSRSSDESLRAYPTMNTTPHESSPPLVSSPDDLDGLPRIAPLRPRKRDSYTKDPPEISVLTISPDEEWRQPDLVSSPYEHRARYDSQFHTSAQREQGSPTLGFAALPPAQPDFSTCKKDSEVGFPDYQPHRRAPLPPSFDGRGPRHVSSPIQLDYYIAGQGHPPSQAGRFAQRQSSEASEQRYAAFREGSVSSGASYPVFRQDSVSTTASYPDRRLDSMSSAGSHPGRKLDSISIAGGYFNREYGSMSPRSGLSERGHGIAILNSAASDGMIPREFSNSSGSQGSSFSGSATRGSFQQSPLSSVGSASSKPVDRSGTIMMPANSPTLTGRPCKSNNYWGFCKGAWNTREGIKKGLRTQTRPEGMYGKVSFWQCRQCSFQGDAFGKETAVDPRVHIHPSGITYRWIFLAKSHCKRKSGDKVETNFGCMFCCAEGHTSGIYGNADTLMNHIYLEHSKHMAQDVQQRTLCVFGRVASNSEDFDINIPFM